MTGDASRPGPAIRALVSVDDLGGSRLAPAQRIGDDAGVDPRVPRARASEALRPQLQPGEQMTASAAVLSAPPGWAVAGLLLVCLAEVAAAVLGFLGLVPSWLPGTLSVPMLAGLVLLPRRLLVAVTGQRLLCWRLSRLRQLPGGLVFAVPLTGLRVTSHRPGRSIGLGLPGGQRIRLDARAARRGDFAAVADALGRAGAFASLEPPYPALEQPRNT